MAKALRGLAVALAASVAHATPLDGSGEALRMAWTARNAPAESVQLESAQSSDTLSGTLYGVIERPFADVAGALAGAPAWCAVLILDPNVHRCRPQDGRIEVAFGESEMPVSFALLPAIRTDDYLQVGLAAAHGPFGTRDYAIALEAAPLDRGRALVHLVFSHKYGLGARLAMLAYFNTLGRGKVGFTVVDRDAQGRPVYVKDLRGGIERNLTRYYFAIVAYLDSLSAPSSEQPDRRVRAWLALTERYPRQLHEEAGYFERKAPDVRRQHAGG
jgi:hypothetical protein